ncbi:MAG: transglycosylase SLT domain-containing protein [Gammaproteobacteria bacterium]
MRRLALLIALAGVVAGCWPVSHGDDVCVLLSHRRGWYASALQAYEKWGVPVSVQLAIIYQESKFSAKAMPPRLRVFGLIPWGRASSSYGYAQATESTWRWYMQKTGNHTAVRDDFSDAVDFIGWYCSLSEALLGISKADAYHQYLAYHEGHRGFQNRTYDEKLWLLRIASEVEGRADRYRIQLNRCDKELRGCKKIPVLGRCR